MVNNTYRLGSVLGTAVAYSVFCELNTYLFSSFSFSTGVDWIFLPSGLRLAFILIFGIWGALGIVLASFIGSFNLYFNGDLITALGAGLISGFTPLMARRISCEWLKLDVHFTTLPTATFIKVVLLFAVLSPVMHQLWYTCRGHTENFMNSTLVMAAGDLTGTIAVLFAAKSLLSLVPDTWLAGK